MNLSQRLKAERILQIVCSEFEITEEELRAKCKKGRNVKSRATAIMIMCANNISYRQAAQIIGLAVGSAHECSQNAIRNHKVNKEYRKEVYNIITKFHNENNNPNQTLLP